MAEVAGGQHDRVARARRQEEEGEVLRFALECGRGVWVRYREAGVVDEHARLACAAEVDDDPFNAACCVKFLHVELRRYSTVGGIGDDLDVRRVTGRVAEK